MELKSFKVEKKRPWPLVLGLDISPKSMKYLLLRRRGKGLLVEGFGKYSLEGESLEFSEKVQRAVNRLFQKGKGLKKARKVVGIDGANVIIRKESVPPLSKKEIQQTIYFGVEKDLAGEDEGTGFVYDYQAVGRDPENKDNTEYLIVAASSDVVDEKLNPFIAEGIIPTKVIPAVLSMANLAKFVPETDNKKIVGILDIGAERSMLVLLRNGQMDFFREIVVGGDDFTRAITGTIFHEGRAIQFTTDEALEFKLRYGYPIGFSEGMTFHGAPLAEVAAMMRPVVERLIGEIQRSIGFYKDKFGGEELEILYLVGGGARLKHLPEVLIEKIGIPVSPLPVLKGLRVSGGKKQQEIFKKRFLEQAVSLSLALETSQERNLLPPPYKKIQQIKLVEKSLRYAAAAVIGLFIFLSFNMHKQILSLRKHVAVVENRVSHSKNTGPIFAALLNKKNLLEGKIANLNPKMEQDDELIQVLKLFSHVVPKKLSFIYLKYGKEKAPSGRNRQRQKDNEKPKWIVRVRGVNKNPPSDVGIYVAKLIVELEKSGYFSEVKMENDGFSPENKEYAFEIVGYLNKK